MTEKSNYVPNQILAMQKVGVSEADVKKSISEAGGTILKITSNGTLTAILINVGDVETARNILQKSGHFDAIQLNYLSHH